MRSSETLGRSFWICAGFTFLSAIVSVIFSLLALRMKVGHAYALYAASRSVALPLAILYAMLRRSRGGIAALALAMTVVQFLDGFIGLQLHDPDRMYGPIAFAAINVGLFLWMNRTSHTLAEPTN